MRSTACTAEPTPKTMTPRVRLTLRNVLDARPIGPDDEFEILFATRPLTPDESTFLDRMFPHTRGRAEHLLNVETVLASIKT